MTGSGKSFYVYPTIALIKKSFDSNNHHSAMGRMAHTTAIWSIERLSYSMMQDELYWYVKDRSYHMVVLTVLGNKYSCSRTGTFANCLLLRSIDDWTMA